MKIVMTITFSCSMNWPIFMHKMANFCPISLRADSMIELSKMALYKSFKEVSKMKKNDYLTDISTNGFVLL